MKICLYLTLLVFLPAAFLMAQSYTVSGYVIDGETGETLIGVNVVAPGEKKGAASDNNGYFWISDLLPGNYSLEFSYIGYATKKVEIVVQNQSMILDEIALVPEELLLDEITVTAQNSELVDPEIETSPIQITQDAIRNIPAVNKDLFKSLKYFPGVEGLDPLSQLYAVRGSDSGENLVLLDGITIYNPYHFVTGTSLFNVYALKKAEMLVGGFGAEYGGRNSSVLYITSREGNSKSLHGEIEPTTTMTKAAFDFPIGEKLTMMVSGRYYYNLIARFLMSTPNYFYDTNISLNWKINAYNRVNLRYFQSRDYMDYSFSRLSHYFKAMLDNEEREIFDNYDIIFNTIWNNHALSFSLKSIISPAVYLETQLSGSFFSAENRTAFEFQYTDDEDNKTVELRYDTDIQNKISDLGANIILNVNLYSANAIKLGLKYNQYRFNNDIRINSLEEGLVTRKPDLISTFVEDKITLGNFSIRPGIRFSKFGYADQWYQEPRLNAVVKFRDDYKLKFAWGQYYQYIISINSQEYELSQFLDYYYPLRLKSPGASTHYIFGMEKALLEVLYVSVNCYYKNLSRVYTFDYNASELDIFHFSDKLKEGSGKSYGIELFVRGRWNNLSGWLSYGLSRSTRSYPHIMKGKDFLFDYNRTHSLKAFGHYQVNPSLSFSATCCLLSGVPRTLESGIKSYFYYDPQSNQYSYYFTYINNVKNNGRMPCILDLDLGMKKHLRTGFGAELADFLGASESYVNIALENILFFLHRNVIYYFPIEIDNSVELYGLGTNYFPMISAGYTVKF